MTTNYYKVLGVAEDAEINDIKKAFRIKAFQTHPDKSHNSNSKDFILVYEAYQILKNDSLRQKYDEALMTEDPSLLQSYLEKIRQRAKRYAADFRSYERQFYFEFVLDIIIGTRRLSLAALALILIGFWSIFDGAIKLDTPIILIGTGMVTIGFIFMFLALRKFRRDWLELENMANQYSQ